MNITDLLDGLQGGAARAGPGLGLQHAVPLDIGRY